MTAEQAGRLDRGDGVELAWRRLPGRGPGVVFLGGFNSDMTGSKAEDLSAFCAAQGRAFLRFDYSGHGTSGGRFEDGTIGRWAADAAAVLDALTEGPQILVGSSMGGWIALLLALRRPGRVAGLVGIAAAPDFTTVTGSGTGQAPMATPTPSPARCWRKAAGTCCWMPRCGSTCRCACCMASRTRTCPGRFPCKPPPPSPARMSR
jgi:pimeloyl-ACP methyl ester carboxylesterase